MVFSSMIFLWLFLPLVLFFYFISNDKYKNIILLIFSLIFYAWGEPKYILLMLFSIFINYLFGILIDKYRKYDKLILLFNVLINLGLLMYFKYFNFLVGIINRISGFDLISLREIVLPIGISFYTFQILSYIIDLYKKEIKVQKNLLNFSLYVSFFPQLIAGPIVKYKDVDEEISTRHVDLTLFASGIRKFVYGLGKKVLISNTLALVADQIYSNQVSELNTPIVWLAVIAYTFQIYFDFSGYSDMAIGLGRMFGFHFLENFNLPYISESITEFWRRWHISLSTWFKEYLYIPLGGNRKGKRRTYINLFIVFLATGLWHGASFNFVFWGIYYGIFLVFEKLFLKKMLDQNKYKILNHIYVMLIVIVGWVLFRVEGFMNALNIIKLMFSFDFSKIYLIVSDLINFKTITAFILAIMLSGPCQIFINKLKNKEKLLNIYSNYIEFFVIIIILIFSIIELVVSSYNPFIYFRF